jgi:hypothetical protein
MVSQKMICLILYKRRRRAQVQRAVSQRRFEKPEIDSKLLDRPNILDIIKLKDLGSLREKPKIIRGELIKAELYNNIISILLTAASLIIKGKIGIKELV